MSHQKGNEKVWLVEDYGRHQIQAYDIKPPFDGQKGDIESI